MTFLEASELCAEFVQVMVLGGHVLKNRSVRSASAGLCEPVAPSPLRGRREIRPLLLDHLL
jgi:hypothetical protein